MWLAKFKLKRTAAPSYEFLEEAGLSCNYLGTSSETNVKSMENIKYIHT